MGKAVVKMLEQSHSGIETKHSRLTERLTTLETTGDAILSRQRSAEGRINELTAGISTLGSQSSGWWFGNCRNSNLNGPYEKASNGYGIEWGTWADAAKFSKMMIRRK
ncbi:hypothetical protein pipiens_014782 [Culex pipiens pipiens]|uniref:Fibrinogen C-terminal domain-containing protein n=1 Tax=Culex pipiens pipiens TaxID=38569 RepID=A0ABD1CT66_CULPP